MKVEIELDNGVGLHWPTPIFNRKFENTDDMNRRLVDIIHEKEKTDVGIAKSVSGGWHSKEDVHTWDFPEVKRLIDFISQATLEMTITSTGLRENQFGADSTYIAWANILRSGGYHRTHTHPGCAWSGVYYVQSGFDLDHETTDDGGFIEFQDPRSGVEMVPVPGNPFGKRLNLPPEEGRLYAFPAWLKHTVIPYQGLSERITIAFNVRIENFELFE